MHTLWQRLRFRQPWPSSTIYVLVFLGFVHQAMGMFDEPKPLAIWEDPVPTLTKPQSWREKSFGQWCRNFTTNSHVQCPQGSPVHWYYCCGHMNTECCLGLQTWTFVIFGSLIVLFLIIAAISVLAYADLLWSNEKSHKKISSQRYASVQVP
ncbi:Protein of unknown function DUF2650 family-containing protein [Aphelenchoides besseyi]|nr:Protein of unknown function DUF2650 family-containing protein [Aphelenchoides besseyi]